MKINTYELTNLRTVQEASDYLFELLETSRNNLALIRSAEYNAQSAAKVNAWLGTCSECCSQARFLVSSIAAEFTAAQGIQGKTARLQFLFRVLSSKLDAAVDEVSRKTLDNIQSTFQQNPTVHAARIRVNGDRTCFELVTSNSEGPGFKIECRDFFTFEKIQDSVALSFV